MDENSREHRGMRIQLVNGESKPAEPDAPFSRPYLSLRSVVYGQLTKNMFEQDAVADLLYDSGGTANWHYLYIYHIKAGEPELMAWLESGSRADRWTCQDRRSRGPSCARFCRSIQTARRLLFWWLHSRQLSLAEWTIRRNPSKTIRPIEVADRPLPGEVGDDQVGADARVHPVAQGISQ